MASVIVVMIIFVLLALAILFICQNGGWQGGCGGNCAGCHKQMRRSGKEAEEITLASLCEGGGQKFRSPFARGAFSCPAVAQMHKNRYTYR